MVSRFIGSGREKEGGFLAVHKRSFNAHATGGDFRHGADDIDMNPALSLYPAGTVQGTLELIAGSAASAGSGFVSIGNVGADGYAIGSYNVGLPATPTFRAALLASFTDARLQNGGIVFVLPGTYKLNTTVDVPAGITIMGEVSSSIVIGEMSEEPMFRFLRATDFPTVGGDSGSGDIPADVGSPIDQSGLFNIILADNLDGYVGSTGQADSTMQTVPMVEMEASARVRIENVKFFGRVNNGLVLDRGKTYRAIGTTAGGSTGTHLTVKRCFIDGVKIGIDFSPGNGDLDHLMVDQCRARVFGDESAAPATLGENSFVSMSLCNFTATDNYVVGYGTFGTQWIFVCFVISSDSTGGGGDDVGIHVTGTTGAPTSGLPSHSVFWNEAGSGSGSNWSLKAHIANNNWGSDLNSSWHVTVGGSGNIVDDQFGDFQGPSAIDLLLTATFEYPVTVIVNSGTYEVTVEDSTLGKRYNFIGNDTSGADRPIFDMNLGAGATTDEIGNRTFTVGSKTEGIRFRSNNAITGTTSFHSIRPDNNGGEIFVRNCVFENCTLSCAESADNVRIIDCLFSQNNTFPDNMSLLATADQTVIVEGCQFSGNGYAGFIGYDPGISYGSPVSGDVGEITVNNCIMDIQAPTYGIDDASPMTVKGYFVIDSGSNTNAHYRVRVSDCQIFTAATLAQENIINVGIIAGMTSFVFIRARDINVENTVVNSPTQIKSFGVPFPGVLLVPFRKVQVGDSTFFNGGPPCQISGYGGAYGNSGTTLGSPNLVMVDGCDFNTSSDQTTITLLDIDLDPFGIGHPVTPKVIVSNNTFRHTDSTDDLAVQHFDITGVSYFAHGVVQIYAFEIPVDFNNNKIYSSIPSSMPLVSGSSHAAGLVIHNNINTTGNKGETLLATINVHDNDLYMTNDNEAFYVGDILSTISLFGLTFDVHDNNLQFNNQNWPSSSGWQGVAYFDSQLTQTGNSAPDSMVHNNTFSRKTTPGVLTSIDNYVQIPASAEPGRLVENIFDSEYANGAVTTLVLDSSSSWHVYQNKNQTVTVSLHGSVGTHSVDDVANGPATGTSRIELGDQAFAVPVDNIYPGTDNGNLREFKWLIAAWDVLPYGVELIEVALDYDISSASVPATTNDLYFRIFDTGTNDLSPVTNPGLAPATKTYTPVSTFINTPTDRVCILIWWRCQENATGTKGLEYEDFRITYRW